MSVPRNNLQEARDRLLADLEDAYGPVIREARTNPLCTDIAVNEDGSIWLTLKGQDVHSGEYLSHHAAMRIVSIVADIDGQSVEHGEVNANLPTGERFAALLPPVTRGVVISIRLPMTRVIGLGQYVADGVMTEAQADLLRRAVALRWNILVAGGTGAGKTTMGNAVLAEGGFRDSRTYIAQDQDELRTSGANVVRAFTSPQKSARDLVKAALRHKPDRIVIGEIRDGATGLEWVSASNTGHPGGLSTLHANSAQHAMSRLARLIGQVVANIPHEDIAEAVDLVVYIERQPDGTRKVKEIVRPIGYDSERKKYLFEPV